ncbi:uncharacterized protein EKO05_0011411 [Ascochyta rabiei]|uniref:uncharacterized protein n=1 Tax=Didymella rabiei TaxID=5454 RepID=UPI0021FCA657|nr:uncharacterized protein EKO05_0011411 [Ascochyta rabiei]UPX21217.1 hypothetical protein EKO05_0011411 [Ascochyta rabiei]
MLCWGLRIMICKRNRASHCLVSTCRFLVVDLSSMLQISVDCTGQWRYCTHLVKSSTSIAVLLCLHLCSDATNEMNRLYNGHSASLCALGRYRLQIESRMLIDSFTRAKHSSYQP